MARTDRREFLKLSAVAGAGMILPGCFLFDEPEMLIGPVKALDQGEPIFATFNRKQIMATRLDGEIVIFSLICRHKRCTVKWEAFDEQFACPCHEGLYDKNGRVIDGPPPGPLYRFRHEIRSGELWVLNEYVLPNRS